MAILSQPLHKYQDGKTFIAASIDNGQLVIAATGNEEKATEGNYGQLVVVMNLKDAIAMAKGILATQEANEDAKYDAWIEEQAKRREDYAALVDSALEHEIAF